MAFPAGQSLSTMQKAMEEGSRKGSTDKGGASNAFTTNATTAAMSSTQNDSPVNSTGAAAGADTLATGHAPPYDTGASGDVMMTDAGSSGSTGTKKTNEKESTGSSNAAESVEKTDDTTEQEDKSSDARAAPVRRSSIDIEKEAEKISNVVKPDANTSISQDYSKSIATVEAADEESMRSPTKKLHDLMAEIDPNYMLHPDVEELLLQIADDFVEQATIFACRLARHRASSVLEARDIQLCLDMHYGMRVPGVKSNKAAESGEPKALEEGWAPAIGATSGVGEQAAPDQAEGSITATLAPPVRGRHSLHSKRLALKRKADLMSQQQSQAAPTANASGSA